MTPEGEDTLLLQSVKNHLHDTPSHPRSLIPQQHYLKTLKLALSAEVWGVHPVSCMIPDC
jgi:hypothetical protein